MLNNVFFSVILPVYNRESCVSRAIDSVLSQTYSIFELIIVDDCSTDSTYKVAKSYSDVDNRVKVVSLPKNGGVCRARNAGMDYVLSTTPPPKIHISVF